MITLHVENYRKTVDKYYSKSALCFTIIPMNLLTLTNKRYIVPENNVPYFEPTFAERQKLLKKHKSFFIIGKPGIKPRKGVSAVDAPPTQKP